MKQFIVEGIDIDIKNKIVSFNPNHEKNVNTSIDFNPSYRNINGLKIISIFSRNKINPKQDDGNPLVYALKQLKGWKIHKTDVIKILKQFVNIVGKIKPKYDTIVVMPSTNELNTNFTYHLNKIIKCDNVVEGWFLKLPITEVMYDHVDWNAMTEEQEALMNENFDTMEREGNGYFQFKYIKPSIRQFILKSMDAHRNIASYDHTLINGKDILILDDTISSGSSISEFTKNLLKIFTPKSVTVITLFSKV